MFNNNYQDREILDDEQLDRRHSNNILSLTTKVLGSIILLPIVAIMGAQYYGLFKKGRLRLSVITTINLLELLIFLPMALKLKISTIFTSLFKGNFDLFLKAFFLWGIVLGIIAGYVVILIKVTQFKYNPSTLVMNGWQGFKYRDTPWTVFKRKFLQKQLSEGKCYDTEGSPVGLLEKPVATRQDEIDTNLEKLRKYDPEVVYRSYPDAVLQTIISGQTGSGKSICMLSLMYNDILNKIPLCVVDFKKSAEVLYFLSKWAKENGREFYYFTNGEGESNKFYGEQATYDPLSTGDQTSRADFILNLREWDSSSDVYKQRTQEILQGVLFALIKVPHNEAKGIDWDSGNLKQLISALDLNNMYDLVNYLVKQMNTGKLNETEKLRVSNFMSNFKQISDKKSQEGKALREQLAGIKTVINKLIMSSYGKWLMSDSSKKHIDLLKAATSEDAPIILFAFSAQEEPDFAKSMGQVIMSDLNRASAAKTGMNDSHLFGVYVDEFQTLNPKFMADLLAKARSAGFFITIASQSLEQISAAATDNADATLQSILDVCGNYLFLKGAKQDSAEHMAKIMGQTKHIIRQVQTRVNSGLFQFNIFNTRHGIVSTRTEDDWIISPSEFQNLKDARATNGQYSEAYFISSSKDKYGKVSTAGQKIRIIAQKDLLPGPSQEFKDFISQQTYKQLQQRDTVDNDIEIEKPIIKINQSKKIDSNPFAALKSLHKINNDDDDDDEKVSEKPILPKIIKKQTQQQVSKENKQQDAKSQIINNKINKKQPNNPVREEKHMTTFERIQAQKNKDNKKQNKDKFPGKDEPELLSRNIERIPHDNKKFKLPKL